MITVQTSINAPLSPQLAQILGNEKANFVVVSRRIWSLKDALSTLLFGVFWLAVTCGSGYFFFVKPLLSGEEVHFETNGVATVASWDNLEPLLIPAIMFGVFILVGLGMIGLGIYLAFRGGVTFVGTPTRLICASGKTIESIDWSQFSGKITISGTNENGNLILGMTSGEMMEDRSGSEFVHDEIEMMGISDLMRVEQICRTHIASHQTAT